MHINWLRHKSRPETFTHLWFTTKTRFHDLPIFKYNFFTINVYACLEFFIFEFREFDWFWIKEQPIIQYTCYINSENKRKFTIKIIVCVNLKFEYFGNSNAMGLLQLSTLSLCKPSTCLTKFKMNEVVFVCWNKIFLNKTKYFWLRRYDSSSYIAIENRLKEDLLNTAWRPLEDPFMTVWRSKIEWVRLSSLDKFELNDRTEICIPWATVGAKN